MISTIVLTCLVQVIRSGLHMQTSTLGRNLRSIREHLGWSRATLARESGVSEPTIARVELYGAQPRLDTLVAWADALGTDVSTLLGRRKRRAS